MSAQLLASPPSFLPASIELENTPFHAQEMYQCGPAALATVLNQAGIKVTPAELVPMVYIPGRQGTLQIELLSATRRYGRLPYLLKPTLETLVTELKAGKPVLVLQNLGVSWLPQWHYAVVIGYDLQQQKLILRSGTIKRYMVDMSLFERTWQRADHWGLLVLTPGELPVVATEAAYFHTVADFEKSAHTGNSIPAFRAGLQRWPGSVTLGTSLGNAYYRNGQIEPAIMAYQQVLQHHPDYAPAHNNIAQILLEQGKLEEARRHAEKAVSLGGRYQKNYQSTLDDIQSKMTPSSLPGELPTQ